MHLRSRVISHPKETLIKAILGFNQLAPRERDSRALLLTAYSRNGGHPRTA